MANQADKPQAFGNRALDALVLLGTAAIAGVYALRRISDSDLWHHLRCGQYFASTGSILKTFYYNCSLPNDAYLNHEWLFQTIVYSVEKWGGEAALMALQMILILGMLLILCQTLRLYSNNLALIAVVIALGVAASSHRFSLRPQHFSYVFMAYFLFGLHQFQRGRIKYAYAFPVLMLLWVNLHAECLWGLVVPGVFIAVEAIKRKLGRAQKPDCNLRLLLIILAVTALASLANPFGCRTVIWPLIVMREMRRGVDELLAPTSLRFLFFWIYCALAVCAVLARFRRIAPVWAVMGVIFGVVAWDANRGIPHFFLVTAPVIVLALDGDAAGLRARPRMWIALRLGVLAAMALLVMSVVTNPAYLKRYDSVPYPEGAVAFLKREGIQGNVFNEHLWGGYLLWESYPGLRPYIDGRFYKRSFFKEFQSIRNGESESLNALDRHRIGIVMLNYLESEGAHLGDLLFAQPSWTLVYWDDVSMLFLKNTAAHQAALAAHGNRVVNPERQFLFQYEGMPAAAIEQARERMERNLQYAPTSFRALIMAGNAHLALGAFDRAAARYESALEHLDPANAWIFYKLGFCYAKLGVLDKATHSLEQCVKLAPRYDAALQLLDEVRSRQPLPHNPK
jgi:hypothetical protein